MREIRSNKNFSYSKNSLYLCSGIPKGVPLYLVLILKFITTMKTKSLLWLCLALFICSGCETDKPELDDPTKFSSSSIVGVWACIATNNLTYDVLNAQVTTCWDYDPNAETYLVQWYFDIQNDSKVKYVNMPISDNARYGEYRKSDGYLHLQADSEWMTLVDADYVFDVEHQAIRCPSGSIMGYQVESVADWLGNDTIFYVKRNSIDEAIVYDNTGALQSQYVVRVKGIKKDL